MNEVEEYFYWWVVGGEEGYKKGKGMGMNRKGYVTVLYCTILYCTVLY